MEGTSAVSVSEIQVPVCSSTMAFGYVIATQEPSPRVVMVRWILESLRTVTEKGAPPRRQAATNAAA